MGIKSMWCATSERREFLAYLWLQIAVSNLILMDFIHTFYDLMEELAGLYFVHTLLRHDEIEHLATE